METPTATLVDLGTEFAADVDRDGNGEVHVFRGEVIVKPRSLTDARPLRLIQAQATRIDAASATPSGIEIDTDRFLRQLDEPRSNYSQLVAKLQPEIYLRMEPTADGRSLLDSGSPGGSGRLDISPAYATPWLPGIFGSAHPGSRAGLRRSRDRAVFHQADPATRSAWLPGYSRSRDRGARPLSNSGALWAIDAFISGFAVMTAISKFTSPVPTVPSQSPVRHAHFRPDAGIMSHSSSNENVLRLYRDGVEVAKAHHSGLNHSNLEVVGVSRQAYGHGRCNRIRFRPRSLARPPGRDRGFRQGGSPPEEICQLYESTIKAPSSGQP